jgi:parvulin-like peptidyl-prolyl isomerase
MSKLDEITALQIQGNDVSLSEVLKTLLVSGKTRFLQSAAEELVTAKAAKSLGIEVDDEQLQQAADAYRRRRGMISIKATHAWLKQEGWTVDDFELHLERKLIRTQVVDQVASPEKIDAHFSEHRRAYDQAFLSRIVVKTESLAQELRAQIEDDGADFGQLARQHSLDTSTAKMGGTLGLTDRTTLPASLESVVFATEDNSVVGPVETEDGFELMKVHRLLLGTLDKNVTEAIRYDLFSQWVAEQLQAANVTYSLFETLNTD